MNFIRCRAVVVVFLLAFSAADAAAQLAVGDSLWRMGKRSEAVEQYLRIIASDSLAVRANFRVAEDLAARNIDSALVFLRNARKRVPDDPDLMFTEGTYLSWARQHDAAVLRFDSVLAAHPEFDYVRVARARVLSWKGDFTGAARGYQAVIDRAGSDAASRRDAAFGLAQVAGWQGNLADAESRYKAMLRDTPNDVRSLVGLAFVNSWQGRPITAKRAVLRAMELDSSNADAKGLLATLERSSRPALDMSASWSRDSDDNQVSWQNATQSFLVADGLRAWGTAGLQRANDPLRRTSRVLGEIGGSFSSGAFSVNAALGARQLGVELAPGSPVPDRSRFTWRLGARGKVLPGVGIGVGASHAPFDEIAALLARDIDLTGVDASIDWSKNRTGVALSGGVMDFSDGNRRTSVMGRASQRLSASFTVGVTARTFSYARDGDGYFTPERFILADLFTGWEREIRGYSVAFSAGGGVQRIGPDVPYQEQWHADARLARRFARGASVGFFAGASTSAAASAVGAFRYETFGVNTRIPF